MSNIVQLINKVREEVHGIQKDTFVSTGKSGGYNAVSHDDVIKKLRASLVKHGIVFFVNDIDYQFQTVEVTNKYGNKLKSIITAKVKVLYVNEADPSDYIQTCSIGQGEDHGDKAAGKALSYAVKYSHLKTFALVTGLNDEERIEYTEPAKTQREWSDELRAVTDIQSLKAVWEMIPAGEMKVSLENLKNDIKYRLENRQEHTLIKR